jgi:hypothetical protein
MHIKIQDGSCRPLEGVNFVGLSYQFDQDEFMPSKLLYEPSDAMNKGAAAYLVDVRGWINPFWFTQLVSGDSIYESIEDLCRQIWDEDPKKVISLDPDRLGHDEVKFTVEHFRCADNSRIENYEYTLRLDYQKRKQIRFEQNASVGMFAF